jgi:short subunit fatty acids transporter
MQQKETIFHVTLAFCTMLMVVIVLVAALITPFERRVRPSQSRIDVVVPHHHRRRLPGYKISRASRLSSTLKMHTVCCTAFLVCMGISAANKVFISASPNVHNYPKSYK